MQIVYYAAMRTLLLLLLALLFSISALAKIIGLASSLRHRERMRVPLWLWRLTGWAQLLGVGGLLVAISNDRIRVFVGGWLTMIMIGAVIAHLHVNDPWHHYLTVLTLLLLSLAVIFVV